MTLLLIGGMICYDTQVEIRKTHDADPPSGNSPR